MNCRILYLLFISGIAITAKSQTKVTTAVEEITLPEPYATPSVNNDSKTIGWPEGISPVNERYD